MMNNRLKRVTVRTYNLRPGDVMVANADYVIESAEHFPGTIRRDFANVRFTNGVTMNSVDPDAMVTVMRSF